MLQFELRKGDDPKSSKINVAGKKEREREGGSEISEIYKIVNDDR